MLTLLIDTCTERGILALFNGLQPLFVEQLPFGLQNSSVLLPAIAKGLAQAGVETSQLGMVAVGAGPGSYTGIRVGVAAAKAIAFAHQIPLVGVSTLQGLIPHSDGRYAAVIDAKIGGVYFLQGERVNGAVHYLGEPALAAVEEVGTLLRDVQTLVTPFAGALKARLSDPEGRWVWNESAPDTTQMMRVALERFGNGHYSLNGHLDILYLRKTQAEIEKEQQL